LKNRNAREIKGLTGGKRKTCDISEITREKKRAPRLRPAGALLETQKKREQKQGSLRGMGGNWKGTKGQQDGEKRQPKGKCWTEKAKKVKGKSKGERGEGLADRGKKRGPARFFREEKLRKK